MEIDGLLSSGLFEVWFVSRWHIGLIAWDGVLFWNISGREGLEVVFFSFFSLKIQYLLRVWVPQVMFCVSW